MASVGSGVHRYATIAERLQDGMLRLPTDAWRDSIALQLEDGEGSAVEGWSRLLRLLGMRSRTWLWVGWSSKDSDEEEILRAALGDRVADLRLPTSPNVSVGIWRRQTPDVIGLLDELGPPDQLCPANGPGWILWCDIEEGNHVHLFVEVGSSCDSGDG